jgi:hypothetical protein
MDQRTPAESPTPPATQSASVPRLQSWASVAARLGALTVLPHQESVAA